MNLHDFAEIINSAVLDSVNCGIDPRNVEVGVQIVPDEGKFYGGIAVDSVTRAFRGFDWDTYKFIIETEGNLVKSDR